MKRLTPAELPWTDGLTKGAYHQQRKELITGGLGASLWQLPPGKKSFPMHSHHVTEEALYVVSGTAKVRTPDADTVLAAGDFVSFPPGGPAHQLVNDGTEPFVYLGLSVSKGVDVVEYPATGKVSSSVGAWPNAKRFIFRQKDQVEYFSDDPDAA
jgi:uncharacterized cupin superfamily protein